MCEGCDWDMKVHLREFNGRKAFYHPVRGDFAPERVFYDVWGNIHYGYVGRAHGVGRGLLVWGSRTFGGGFDAADEITVQRGMDLWDNRGKGLTRLQLRVALVNAIPRLRRATDIHVVPGFGGHTQR